MMIEKYGSVENIYLKSLKDDRLNGKDRNINILELPNTKKMIINLKRNQ